MLELSDPSRVGMSPSRLAHVGRWMRGYVDSGKLPCALTLVARRGEVVLLDHCGVADTSTQQPIAEDTIFRFYSMTKPIVSAAALMLYEEGRFQLDDPLHRYMPEFERHARLRVGGGSTIRSPSRRTGRF